jgi:hypothetical protein
MDYYTQDFIKDILINKFGFKNGIALVKLYCEQSSRALNFLVVLYHNFEMGYLWKDTNCGSTHEGRNLYSSFL